MSSSFAHGILPELNDGDEMLPHRPLHVFRPTTLTIHAPPTPQPPVPNPTPVCTKCVQLGAALDDATCVIASLRKTIQQLEADVAAGTNDLLFQPMPGSEIVDFLSINRPLFMDPVCSLKDPFELNASTAASSTLCASLHRPCIEHIDDCDAQFAAITNESMPVELDQFMSSRAELLDDWTSAVVSSTVVGGDQVTVPFVQPPTDEFSTLTVDNQVAAAPFQPQANELSTEPQPSCIDMAKHDTPTAASTLIIEPDSRPSVACNDSDSPIVCSNNSSSDACNDVPFIAAAPLSQQPQTRQAAAPPKSIVSTSALAIAANEVLAHTEATLTKLSMHELKHFCSRLDIKYVAPKSATACALLSAAAKISRAVAASSTQ